MCKKKKGFSGILGGFYSIFHNLKELFSHDKRFMTVMYIKKYDLGRDLFMYYSWLGVFGNINNVLFKRFSPYSVATILIMGYSPTVAFLFIEMVEYLLQFHKP